MTDNGLNTNIGPLLPAEYSAENVYRVNSAGRDADRDANGRFEEHLNQEDDEEEGKEPKEKSCGQGGGDERPRDDVALSDEARRMLETSQSIRSGPQHHSAMTAQPETPIETDSESTSADRITDGRKNGDPGDTTPHIDVLA